MWDWTGSGAFLLEVSMETEGPCQHIGNHHFNVSYWLVDWMSKEMD